MLIRPRETIEKALFGEGISGGSGKFIYQGNVFITTTLFTYWWREIFFPELQHPRE
jgi:hypothetical protein